jgi:hypothetical protein
MVVVDCQAFFLSVRRLLAVGLTPQRAPAGNTSTRSRPRSPLLVVGHPRALGPPAVRRERRSLLLAARVRVEGKAWRVDKRRTR